MHCAREKNTVTILAYRNDLNLWFSKVLNQALNIQTSTNVLPLELGYALEESFPLAFSPDFAKPTLLCSHACNPPESSRGFLTNWLIHPEVDSAQFGIRWCRQLSSYEDDSTSTGIPHFHNIRDQCHPCTLQPWLTPPIASFPEGIDPKPEGFLLF